MGILLVRALAAVFLVLPVFAAPAFAQVGVPSLAPQDLQMSTPSPLEAPEAPPRSQTLAPFSPGSQTKTVLSLSALFAEGGPEIESGLHWRIFADQPDYNGNHALVFETNDAKAFVTLDPGGYIVHVAYGIAADTRHVVLGTEAVSEEIVLNAGALRFTGTSGKQQLPADALSFDIHRTDATGEQLVSQAKAGQIVRLNAGLYQITSTYGKANAKVQSEVRVEPGKLTDAAVLHKAGRVDLRLLGTSGTEVSDATWSILTPGGDIIVETLAELSGVVLAEGDYTAVARYEGKIYQKEFEVVAGRAAQVDRTQN